MSLKKLGSRRATPVRKVQIVTVAWGESYVSELLSMAWRSLLAPGNLPAFTQRFQTSYLVFTSEQDRPAIERSPQYALLSKMLPIEIRTFSPAEMHADKYEWHWIMWRRGLDQARQDGAMVMLVIPDVLYADGTLARWGDYLDAGKRAIFSIGTWVSQETFLPDFLGRYPLATQDSVTMSKREMLDLLLTHMHPLIAASFRDSGHGIFHAERLTVAVPGEGFVSRMMTSQPFLFDASHYRSDPTGCPENRFEDMVCDEVCVLSAGPMLHLAEFYHQNQPFDDYRITHLSGWSLGNIRPAHRHESYVDYRYPRFDKPKDAASWDEALAALSGMRQDFHAAHAIAQVWHHANGQQCRKASSLIALTALRANLKRAVATDGAFTVFLPRDEAFAGWSEMHMKALLDGNAPEILSIMRNHVFPGRIYLQDGDCVALGDAGKFVTLGGRPLSQVRPDAAGRYARISGQKVRLGCGAAYLVDRLLTDTSVAN